MWTHFFTFCILLLHRIQRRSGGSVTGMVILFLAIPAPQSYGAVGDVVGQPISPQAPTSENFFSVGLAVDGANLYVNRNGDSTIYIISPIDGSLQLDQPSFDTGIPEWPSAMAYDPNRHGLWFGTQKSIEGPGFGDCGDSTMVDTDMPIYFWDFNNDSVTLMFTIPSDFTNPATGRSLFSRCRVDGLIHDDRGTPSTLDDDRIWISDTRNSGIGVFSVSGSFVQGFDSTTIDGSLIALTGIVIGANTLYLANDGVGEVFRTSQTPDALSGDLLPGNQFTGGGGWLADMACDPITFSSVGKTVIWVRTDPRGLIANDLITAYEIEPGGCGAGIPIGACCDVNDPLCKDVPQASCGGDWTDGVSCAQLDPPCFPVHRVILLDRTGSMETAVLDDGRTRCRAAWETANSEIMSFFATHPIGSSVAVWTFAEATAIPLTMGFVDEVSALTALEPLGNTLCAGLTPLAEAVCDSVDALATAFPTAPMETLEVYISSDGQENNSNGSCAGPDSLSGMACGEFDPGSWQQLVCDHAIGNAIMLVKLWGDTDPPLIQSLQTVDTETKQLLGAGISDTVFFQALTDATGGTLTFIEDYPPAQGGTPAFGVTGACCLQNGTCQESISEAECASLGGTHRGENSICEDAPGVCCVAGVGCYAATTVAECDVLGGTHQGGCMTCDLAGCPPTIPTVSRWGMAMMTLLVLTAGTVCLRSRMDNMERQP